MAASYYAQSRWDLEYLGSATIPSSSRTKPAHALVNVSKDLKLSGKRVLDLGCGNGRNAVFLASQGCDVTAVDASGTALKLLQKSVRNGAHRTKISAFQFDIRNALPFYDCEFDLVLDSYCLCHFLDFNELTKIIGECYRVLKFGGKLLTIQLSDQDRYYLERTESREQFGHISMDPVNGIRKLHFHTESFIQTCAKDFSQHAPHKTRFLDSVNGVSYERDVFSCVLEK